MDNIAAILIGSVLTSQVMLIVWLTVASFIFFVALRLRIYGLFILVGGMIPHIIFNCYRSFYVWTEISADAILYSRIADVTLAITLFVTIHMMYKGWKDGLDQLSLD